MSVFTTIMFIFSLLGIASLFGLKAWETRRGYVIAPALRQQADQQAIRLKIYLTNGRGEARKILPFLGLVARYLIHEGALAFARAAHFTGVQAHRLADFVSHKHHFERQAPRSEFLKQVSERPAISDISVSAPSESMATTTLAIAPPRRRSGKKESLRTPCGDLISPKT